MPLLLLLCLFSSLVSSSNMRSEPLHLVRRVMLEQCRELFSGMTQGILMNHQQFLIKERNLPNRQNCWSELCIVLLLPCHGLLIPLAHQGRRMVRSAALATYRKHTLPSGTVRVPWCALCSATPSTSSQATGEKTIAPCTFC